MDKKTNYQIICEKIEAFKETNPSVRTLGNDKVFTLLCIKSNLYKNPSFELSDIDLKNMLVDSVGDGGVDAILADPNSEENNLVICQSKFYQSITSDIVRDAIVKMILFYKSMKRGEYESVNTVVQRRFLLLDAEIGDESKVCFVFYTSAPKSRIRDEKIQKLLIEHGLNTTNYEIQLYFADDIVDEIKEAESRRPTVESGKILIDKANNFLKYTDEAVIVNASAFSIKELYALHSTNLLSRNLRYFVKKRDIDSAINDTICRSPETFWFKNNGITIVCDDFNVSGNEVKLTNFSIVNGGQTTSLLHKSREINKEHDFFLPCKIIRTLGDNEDEKNLFGLEIAKATNSQKAIKQIDLKANAPEQVRFARAMRECGIFYQTKRGEIVPKDYKEDYKNTDLVEVGKLCLAGLFQLPGTSRSKPSSLYLEKYYNPVFNEDQVVISSFVKELLYIDSYYRKKFIYKFDKAYEKSPLASEIFPFAHNARTICIAFAALAARYYNKNITSSDLRAIFAHLNEDKAYDTYFYDIFKDMDSLSPLFPKKIIANKDMYDNILYALFETIILSGHKYYSSKKESDNSLIESNFLKIDRNYYAILKFDWFNFESKIMNIFNE